MQDNIYNFQWSRDYLIRGISKVADIVRPTYGAAGGNIILEEGVPPFHRISNDGKAIMDAIKLSDPIENIGANILKEAAQKIEKESGDGRKTAAILTQSIINEGILLTEVKPMEIKRSLAECLPIILASIFEQTKAIKTKDVESVATIASENEEIGKMIGDIYKEIGIDGIIEIANSGLPNSLYEVSDGVRVRAGCFPYSFTEDGKAVFENPKILISKEKIVSIDQLERIIKPLANAKIAQLVIYCEDIDMSVASLLAQSHLKGGFKTIIIKAPKLWKDWL